MRKLLISTVVIMLVVPQITLAAWWNPFSWFKKQSVQQVQDQGLKTATSTAIEIENLQKRIDELKKLQPTFINSTTTSVTVKIIENKIDYTAKRAACVRAAEREYNINVENIINRSISGEFDGYTAGSITDTLSAERTRKKKSVLGFISSKENCIVILYA